MPNLANITVKKFDGTTDVVYYGIQPGNQNEFSVHKANALGATDETKPELRVQVRRNPNGKDWVATAWYMYPYHVVSTDTGITSVRKKLLMKCTFNCSSDVPAAVLNEFVGQGGNLMAAGLVKSCAIDGGNFI